MKLVTMSGSLTLDVLQRSGLAACHRPLGRQVLRLTAVLFVIESLIYGVRIGSSRSCVALGAWTQPRWIPADARCLGDMRACHSWMHSSRFSVSRGCFPHFPCFFPSIAVSESIKRSLLLWTKLYAICKLRCTDSAIVYRSGDHVTARPVGVAVQVRVVFRYSPLATPL